MTLLDLIEQCLLRNFEKEIYEKDECNFGKNFRKEEKELFTDLPEEQIKKVKHLMHTVKNQMEYIHLESQKYLLNYAFRLGMEMQKAFDKDDYE